jgi:Fe-S-cluster containining protein
MPAASDLEQALLGPLVPGRECGNCVACCDTLRIDTPDFAKAADVACPHNTGSGCGIYPTRPGICRTWFCAWRRTGAMSDAARPDRSGILAFLGFNRAPRNCLEGIYLVACAADSRAFDTPTGRQVIAELCAGLVPVWTNDGKTKALVHPRSEVAACVISGESPPPELEEEVAAWRSRYDMFR